MLFFINMFGWIFEPRRAAVLPYVTYDCQDRVATEIAAALGVQDIGLDKSRDMGASWLVLTIFIWFWLFWPHQSFLLISRTEDLVESREDPDSLFWKLDFLYRHLPKWMKPGPSQVLRQRMVFKNKRNGSVINGCSTTGNAARGGRRRAVLLDEYAAFLLDDSYRVLASTQAVTNTRIFVSTPLGAAGGFYDVMHDPDMRLVRLRLAWWEHPQKQHGLYTTENGKLKVLDQHYEFPPDYPFILDGKLRSPWYDNECRRCPIPTIIAQELDIDYLGSSYLFFDRTVIQRAIQRDARPPCLVGELECNPERGEPGDFAACQGGRLELWMFLDALGRPPRQKYVVGCDIATGTLDAKGKGASKSAAKVYTANGRVLAASLVCSGVKPKEFAGMVVALCRWLTGESDDEVFLGWEANGPGREFGDEVIRLGYRCLYYKPRNDRSIESERTDIPGWWSAKESKKAILAEYERCVASGDLTNRCERALLQMECFVKTDSGSVQHIASLGKGDPNLRGDDHGDEVIADAVANLCCASLHGTIGGAESIEIPEGSFAARRRDYERAAEDRRGGGYWADRRRRRVSYA